MFLKLLTFPVIHLKIWHFIQSSAHFEREKCTSPKNWKATLNAKRRSKWPYQGVRSGQKISKKYFFKLSIFKKKLFIFIIFSFYFIFLYIFLFWEKWPKIYLSASLLSRISNCDELQLELKFRTSLQTSLNIPRNELLGCFRLLPSGGKC